MVASDMLGKIQREGEEREARRKAEELGLLYLDVKTTPVQLEAFKIISEEKARQFKVAPFQFKAKTVALASADPSLAEPLVKELTGQGWKINLFVISQSALKSLWANYKSLPKKSAQITGKVSIEQEKFDELFKKLTSLEAVKKEIANFDFKTQSTGQILEVVLAGAMSSRASDIHFEAEEKDIRFRYRVDGLLRDVIPEFDKKLYPMIVSRIKLLSNLKLNVKDQPQDGRFTISHGGKDIEIRVSLIPSEYGETIVMRVLDPSAIQLKLSDLGIRADDLKIVEKELNAPNGMILNTGPTGSGKTTTLYAFLLHKQKPEIKIITIEDPIEYHLEDIEQTQVNEQSEYTFAGGLRSIMRQDPDVILVGEIRDEETSGIAIQAALTGHLVFSTVHANSAAGAIPRLLDLKVKPASIGPALNLVIAQRLVRRLCPDCKQPDKISPETQKNIEKFLKNLPTRVDKKPYGEINVFKAKGCAKCGQLGYKGRVAVFELMEVGDEMEGLISESIGEAAIKKQSLKQGMVTMQQDGILKVLSGVTTLDEVGEITGDINWDG